VRSLDLATARDAGLVTDIDPAPEYIAHVARLVDLDALRAVGCHVAVDAMHGAGAGYLTALLSGGATTVTEVRGNVNPAFPDMHNPEPIDRNLRPLRDAVLSSNALVGVAMDGDADRVGAIDGSGEYITALQVFGLLTYYLLEVRGFRGPLVKSLTTSNMVSRLGERYGVPVHETSVGFKYIAPLMLETDALIGGEESGGFGFRGHIPERDGVLSALFLLDLVARKGVTLSTVIDEIYGLVGPHHYDRLDVVFDAANRPAVEGRLFDAPPGDPAGAPAAAAHTVDGIRYRLEGGEWAVVRFSGTEPLLRIYAEAPSTDRVRQLLEATRALTGV
ncbi:MAG: phosphoglucomutase/phosphomannomutase family protein, partial [Chloroflexota bacterium]|nr:phosphoglucomutase/phosphomannomutase family protein [Chloroflexota bacterium]